MTESRSDGHTPLVPESPFEARKLLLDLRDIDKESEHVKQLKRAVLADYDTHLDKLEEQRQQLRHALNGFVQLYGKTVIPDVGTVFVQNRKSRLTVADEEKATAAALAWDREGGRLWRPELVKGEFLKVAQEMLETTGEVAAGTELLPASSSVAIRWKGQEGE